MATHYVKDVKDKISDEVSQDYNDNDKETTHDFHIKIELEDNDNDTNDREVSDDMADACKTSCQICQKVFLLYKMRLHTKKEHMLQITQYKQIYGNFDKDESLIIKKVYHKCHICGKIVLLDNDRLGAHVKSIHKMKEKNYKDLYMIPTPRKGKTIQQKKYPDPLKLPGQSETNDRESSSAMTGIRRSNGRTELPYWRRVEAKTDEHKGVKSRATENIETQQNFNTVVRRDRDKANDCVILKEEPASENPREWTVAQTVAAIIRTDPSIDPEDIKAIRDHKIDGKALLELSFDELVKYGKVMLGPASKIRRLAEMWKNKSDEFM